MLKTKYYNDICEGIKKGDFKSFKKYYDYMSFEDRVKIEEYAHKFFPKQQHFKLEKILEIFDFIINKYDNKYLNIMEFGCHNGSLACQVLNEVSEISIWTGFDINVEAIKEGICNRTDRRLYFYLLNDYLYNTKIDEPCDIFISTHTLEHVSNDEFFRYVEFIKNIKYLIIEIPISKSKHSYNDSHVLSFDKSTFFYILNLYGYELFYLYRYGKNNSVYVCGFKKK